MASFPGHTLTETPGGIAMMEIGEITIPVPLSGSSPLAGLDDRLIGKRDNDAADGS